MGAALHPFTVMAVQVVISALIVYPDLHILQTPPGYARKQKAGPCLQMYPLDEET